MNRGLEHAASMKNNYGGDLHSRCEAMIEIVLLNRWDEIIARSDPVDRSSEYGGVDAVKVCQGR